MTYLFANMNITVRKVALLLSIFSVLNIPFMSTFSLSIDDEKAAFRQDPYIWISQGRWTTYLLEQLWLNQPSMTYFPILLLGLGLSTTFLIMTDAHRVNISETDSYLLFVLFSTFPTWFFISEFYANLPAVALGVVLVALCVQCFVSLLRLSLKADRSKIAILFSIGTAALSTAIGAYQSFFSLRNFRICRRLADARPRGCKNDGA